MRGSYKEALRDPRARRPLKGRRRIRLHVEAAELEPRLLLSGAGSLDSTFASAGVFSNEFLPQHITSDVDEGAYAVAVENDGSIALSGYVTADSGDGYGDTDTSATVGHLSALGSLLGETVYTSGPSDQGYQNSVDYFSSIVEDGSGNPVLNNGGKSELMLVGQETASSNAVDFPNTYFSVATTPTSIATPTVNPFAFDTSQSSQSYDVANAAVFQQASNTILVAGTATASSTAFPLALITLNGSLDGAAGTVFDGTGNYPAGTYLFPTPGFENPEITAMALVPSATPGNPPPQVILAGPGLLVCLNTSNDSPVDSFGTKGIATIPFSMSVSGVAFDQVTDDIIVAGTIRVSGTGTEFGMVAFTPQGKVDTTFGSDGTGLVTTDFGKGSNTAESMAIQSDGKIVLAGSATVSSGETIAALARYLPGGALDPSFGNGGLVTTDPDNSGASVYNAVAIDPTDGKIVATGEADGSGIANPLTVVARYIGLTPVITQLSQTSARAGAASFTLTVTGSGFVNGSPGSAVDWNGTALATTFVSSTSLQATVPASDLQTAGTASVTVTNPGDITSSAATFTISASPVVPTIMWSNPANIVYGTPLTATQLDAKASANGASIAGNFVYTPVSGTVLHVGVSQKLSVAFTPTDTADYADASGSVSITVTKATPSLSIHAGPSVYDGNSQPATITITGVNGDNLSSQVTLTYNGSTAAPVGAGTYTVKASFPGDSDYNAISETAQMVNSQAVPVINWPAPAPITVGTPLSGTQLDATASTPGMFTYTPIAGTVLGAGSNQVVSLSFSPADSTDYQSTTASVLIDVLAQPAVIAVTPVQSKKGLTSITVLFNESMEQGSAASAANYSVLGAVKKKKHTVYTKSVGKLSFSYSDSSRTVTITLKKPYKGMVQVNASSGILAADGAATGSPFVTILA